MLGTARSTHEQPLIHSSQMRSWPPLPFTSAIPGNGVAQRELLLQPYDVHAAGFEHREHDGFFQPDAVVVAGETAGVPSSPTSGGFDVDELYLELDVPLLADKPGAELLAISGAARNSDAPGSTSAIPKLGIPRPSWHCM